MLIKILVIKSNFQQEQLGDVLLFKISKTNIQDYLGFYQIGLYAIGLLISILSLVQFSIVKVDIIALKLVFVFLIIFMIYKVYIGLKTSILNVLGTEEILVSKDGVRFLGKFGILKKEVSYEFLNPFQLKYISSENLSFKRKAKLSQKGTQLPWIYIAKSKRKNALMIGQYLEEAQVKIMYDEIKSRIDDFNKKT